MLAGNSVHADASFLAKGPYKKVLDHLSHRIIDVSSFKECAKCWCPLEVLLAVPKKKYVHRAKDDILESIEEMRYYKEAIFQNKK